MAVRRSESPLYELLFAVAGLTVIAFLPVLRNGFVNWDDGKNFVLNHAYRGLGWPHLQWMFTTFYMGMYRPIGWVTLGLDYALWGMHPAGYHLTSLLFHAANAILVYFIALELLSIGAGAKEKPLRLAAAFAALFFTLHPLRVEAVAWASARADPVAATFIFLSLLCYLRATNTPAYRTWMIAAWVSGQIWGQVLFLEFRASPC